MEQIRLDFNYQAESLLKLILGQTPPTAQQISLVALKLRQTFEDGMSYSQQ